MYVEPLYEHGLPLPTRSTEGSAGIDLRACLNMPVTLDPGERKVIPTGYRWNIGGGNVGFVCPRSGLAVQYGITVLNGPGVVDWDYRGEVKVALINLGDEPFTIAHGDRIAQMVVVDYIGFSPMAAPEPLDPEATERGEGGFGSTGR